MISFDGPIVAQMGYSIKTAQKLTIILIRLLILVSLPNSDHRTRETVHSASIGARELQNVALLVELDNTNP